MNKELKKEYKRIKKKIKKGNDISAKESTFFDAYNEGVFETTWQDILTANNIKKKDLKRLRKDIKDLKKENNQRAKRGYSDVDVWNLPNWFIKTVGAMLTQLAEHNCGFPSSLNREWFERHKEELKKLKITEYEQWVCWPTKQKSKGYKIREKANKECDLKWKNTIKHMAYLLSEMDEDTCSMKNPYYDEWWFYHEWFDKKYPDKDVLKTEKELEDERKTNTFLHVGPDRDPDFGEEYSKVAKKMFDFDNEIEKYRNERKNEFFVLFEKYFWELWD